MSMVFTATSGSAAAWTHRSRLSPVASNALRCVERLARNSASASCASAFSIRSQLSPPGRRSPRPGRRGRPRPNVIRLSENGNAIGVFRVKFCVKISMHW